MDQPPDWAEALARRLSPLDVVWPAPVAPHSAAVLVLLSRADDPDLVVTLRSPALAHQPGQMALPGGGREAADESPAVTALRETGEEVGLNRDQIHLLGQLPRRRMPRIGADVVPVVGWWSGFPPLGPIDPGEVAAVVRWPVSALVDPGHRRMARHPGGGTGPAWQIGQYFCWGLTAGIVDAVLRLAGWARPWDETAIVEVPAGFR